MKTKKCILLILILFINYHINAQNCKTEIDIYGNIIVTGSFYDSLVFENSTTVYPSACTYCGLYPMAQDYLLQLDSTGKVLWHKLFGLENFVFKDITSDKSGNIYLAGQFQGILLLDGDINIDANNGNLVLIKYNGLGELLWYRQSEGHVNNYDFDLESDNSSDIYFASLFNGEISFGGKDTLTGINTNTFIAKFDSSGYNLWLTQISGSSEWFLGLDTDTSGNCIVTGHFSDKKPIYFGIDTVVADDGFDAYIAKCSAEGIPLWIKKAESTGSHSIGYDVCVRANNNVMIGGFNQDLVFEDIPSLISNTDAFSLFIANYDSIGNEKWAIMGEPNNPWYQDVIVEMDFNGNSIIVGSFDEKTPIINDISISGTGSFLFKIDSLGNHICDTYITNSIISDVYANNQDKVYVSGEFYDEMNIEGQVYSGLNRNTFIAKFDKDCQLSWVSFYYNSFDSWTNVKDNFIGEKISIYPNPCDNFINVHCEEFSIINCKISIYNITGNLVYNKSIQSNNDKIDVNDLSKGIYILKIKNDKEILSLTKIVKN